MKLDVEAIHHVGLVVKDRQAAERFHVGVLGLEPVPNRRWYRLDTPDAIHPIPFGTPLIPMGRPLQECVGRL